MTNHSIFVLPCLHPAALPQGRPFSETPQRSEVISAFIIPLLILTIPFLHFLSQALQIMLNEQENKSLHDNISHLLWSYKHINKDSTTEKNFTLTRTVEQNSTALEK